MGKKQLVVFGTGLLALYIILQSVTVYYRYISIRNDVGEQAKVIAELALENIDIDEYTNLVKNRDNDSNFNKLQNKLKNFKRISGARYVYVERKLSANKIEYIADADNDNVLGQTDSNDDNEAFSSTEPSIVITNSKQWGRLVTGFAPIVDKDNRVIGLVGVDIEYGLFAPLVRTSLKYIIINTTVMTLLIVVFICILVHINNARNNSIMSFYANIVTALMLILNRKSDYTSKHSENVAILTEKLAHKFYKNSKQIETIKWAALLHDIGKVGISSNILNKQARLTDEEFEEIKKHPVYSKEILEKVFLDDKSIFSDKEIAVISDIAKYHHERWDGNGYPDRIKGEDIPLLARIVCVADAYEAMTAVRPYKKSMSKEDALDQLIKCSGTQFDPVVVEKFKECVKEGKI